MSSGRRSGYNDTMPIRAETLAREGYKFDEIAVALCIDNQTLTNWQNKHPELKEAIVRGRDHFDTHKVERSLRKRAVGFHEIVEETKEPRQIGTEFDFITGQEVPKYELVTVKTVKKLVLPDTTAMIFWLKNRQPKRWRDKQDMEHSGGVTINVNTGIERDPNGI